MSESEAKHATVDIASFWEKLARLEDGSLEPSERDGLMKLLDESKSARSLYLEYFSHSVGLEAEAKFLDEQGRMPVLANALYPWRVFRRSLIAAAAVLALSGIIATLIMIRQPEPAVLATRVAADSIWTVNGEAQDPGEEEISVVEGSRVHVLSGTVRLKLESGAMMVMHGPAQASCIARCFTAAGYGSIPEIRMTRLR